MKKLSTTQGWGAPVAWTGLAASIAREELGEDTSFFEKRGGGVVGYVRGGRQHQWSSENTAERLRVGNQVQQLSKRRLLRYWQKNVVKPAAGGQSASAAYRRARPAAPTPPIAKSSRFSVTTATHAARLRQPRPGGRRCHHTQRLLWQRRQR